MENPDTTAGFPSMHCQSTVAIAFFLLGSCCSFAIGNPGDDDQFDRQQQGIEQRAAEQFTADQLAAEQSPKIEQLAIQLGSHQFARRERAATALMQIGLPAIKALNRIEKSTEDPEVRDRISGLVRQISDAHTQSKIDRFMAGQQVGFEGWNRFREIMGDAITVRELFVQLHLEHPNLLANLDSDPKELSIEMEAVNAKVQHRMFVKRQHPSQADTIALLLPAFNKKVPILAGYETTIIGVLDRLAAQQIRRDARLEPGFRSLIGAWVLRSTLTNRIETLTKAMQWDVPEGLPVAIATLSETDEMQTLVVSMQTIARFGGKKDSIALGSLLTDDRVTGEAGYGAGQLIQSQIRDIAMATIAILRDVPLAEVGFPHATTHAMFGFTILGIGFAESENETRQKNLRRVEAMISPQPTAGS